MLQLLFKTWLTILIDHCSPCQSTIILDPFKSNRRHLIVRYKRIDEHGQTMKEKLNNNSNSEEKIKNGKQLFVLEITNTSTVSNNKPNTLHKLTKALIILIIFAGSGILVSISIGLAIVYLTCSRPSRIQRDLPIEYLNSTEMINYSEVSPSIDSFTSSQQSTIM